jgi:hypothetical protein
MARRAILKIDSFAEVDVRRSLNNRESTDPGLVQQKQDTQDQ